MAPPSLIQQVLDRCRDAMFTGILRVRSRQAEGELWFLSGILEWQKFGVSVGDEALERLLHASDVQIEAIPCLPNPGGGFRRRSGSASFGMEGKLGETKPVDLLRFCESHALTCRVEFQRGPARGEADYRLGDLLQIRREGDAVTRAAGKDSAIAAMLEWSDGQYRVVLPTVELPDRVALRKQTPIARPPTVAASEEDAPPPVTEAEARRKVMNEAVKRKAEEVLAKHGSPGDAGINATPSTLFEPVAEPMTVPSKAKTTRRGKRAGSVVVRVRRALTEEAYVRVPISDALLLPANPDGSRGINGDAVFAEAVRLAARPRVGWCAEAPPRIEVHPTQSPPPAPEKKARRRRART